MKLRNLIHSAAIATAAALLVFALFVSAFGAVMLDKVVAVVNSEVITWSELYKGMEFDATPAVKALPDQQRKQLFKENEGAYLENLINMKLILQAAKSANVGATDEDVLNAIKGIREKYKKTEAEFNEAIKKEGFDLNEYKKKISEQIIVSRVVDVEVRSKILVTDKEVNEFIAKNKENAADEGYRVSMILIKKGKEEASEQKRAKEAYASLKSGNDFGAVAKQYSEDSSAKSGGDLGFVRKGDLSQQFIDQLSKLKKGEYSEPFETVSGIHILKLEEARIFKNQTDRFSAVKEQLYMDKYDRAYKAWLKGLRQNAYVEIR